ncbi:hypothetical protein ACIG0D_26375 [Streptomyces sp. NPDC052773]|uniref:hypothetical protein n=1 Tax=Streptomyces sp. NPDC052773 TaxID=3365693 RepID=UPI0037CD0F03
MLRTRGYARLRLLSLVLGVPITVACFFFVGLQHELRHRVRESLPETAGCEAPVGRADGGADRDSDHAGPRAGRRTERWTGRHTALRTLACATAVGVCLTAYALLTGRSPVEAALSGQDAPAGLAADPHDRPVAAPVALVVCKRLAWGVALGSLRGGPIFPAVLPGAATALACSGLPGFGTTPAFALGVAAAGAPVTGLPLTSAVPAALPLGGGARDQLPLIVTASVVAFVVSWVVRREGPARGEAVRTG